MKREIAVVGGMVCITALSAIHMFKDGDGTALAASISAIAALAGVTLGKATKE